MQLLQKFQQKYIRQLPQLRAGDVVRVHERVIEGDKERTQAFEGLVIAVKHGKGTDAMLTVRKVSGGVGVERTFPLHSPFIQKIEILRHEKVRRAKLYYVRKQVGKKTRKRIAKQLGEEYLVEQPEEVEETEEAEETEMTQKTEETTAEAQQPEEQKTEADQEEK